MTALTGAVVATIIKRFASFCIKWGANVHISLELYIPIFPFRKSKDKTLYLLIVSMFGNIKRLLAVVAALLLGSVAFAQTAAIRDIDISCVLDSVGTAHITECWDVTVASGTEWYLVRENLGDIEIQNLAVKDGDSELRCEERWNVNRTIDEKRGRCGINHTSGGVEICWGVGNYGDHVFTVSYDMTNAVKSLNDYDILHVQFISDELSSNPEHARITVSTPSAQLDTTVARVWGFGYEGNVVFEDGEVIAETSDGLGYYESMIVLLRMDKGVIANPTSVQNRDFDDVLGTAMEGSDWEHEERSLLENIIVGIGVIIGLLIEGLWVFLIPFWIIFEGIFKSRKFLGQSKRSVTWCRDVPFDGDLCTTEYVLEQIGEGSRKNRIAAAMILKMIQAGAIEVRPGRDRKDSVDLALTSVSKLSGMPKPIIDLWNFINAASGSDKVLQYYEFEKWAENNKKKVSDWVDSVNKRGKEKFEAGPWYDGKRLNEEGREEVCRALGFKKFLTDFTLIKERSTKEAVLWDTYIVFGALFGVAKEVVKELKEIDPTGYEEAEYVELGSLNRILDTTNNLANAITSARNQYSYSSGSGGGYGGSSSHGGGGGFSGGGHGGGSR